MEYILEEEGILFQFWCVATLLAFWGLLGFLVYLGIKRKNCFSAIVSLIGPIMVIYLIILINSFSSPIFGHLSRIIPIEEVKELIKKCYRAHPMISLRMECFHFEPQKVISYRATESVQVLSYREISPPFVLDVRSFSQDTSLIKLQIIQNFTFSEDGSNAEYARQLNLFRQSNNWDIYQIVFETFYAKGIPENVMIKLSGKNHGYVGQGWYSIFTFLTLAECYKRYIASQTSYVYYTSTKEISTVSEALFRNQNIPEIQILSAQNQARSNKTL